MAGSVKWTEQTVELIRGLEKVLGRGSLLAYLVHMTLRIVEIHRVLKPTGSFYLHCDPTASHYLKLVCDSVFCGQGGDYKSEISWKRSSAHNDGKQGRSQHGNIRDVIFFYTKGKSWTWNWLYTAYDKSYTDSAYRHSDADGRRYRRGDLTAAKPGGDVSYGWPIKRAEGVGWEADLDDEHLQPRAGWEYKQIPPYRGRYWAYSKANMQEYAKQNRLAYAGSGMPEYKRYLDEMPGVPLQNDWGDVVPASGNENLGYPTQKPEALMERIIRASSNEGDTVLDAYCGCGTTVAVAQRLGRRWIGIDITYQSISLILKRLADKYPADWRAIEANILLDGVPRDLASAVALANRKDDKTRKEFEKWAVLTFSNNQARINEKKGADGGIDGIAYFLKDKGENGKAIFQVKSGGSSRATLATLNSDRQREQAEFGFLITMDLPSKAMRDEITAAGKYQNPLLSRTDDRLQVITVAEILAGKRLDLPMARADAVKSAAALGDADKQMGLL